MSSSKLSKAFESRGDVGVGQVDQHSYSSRNHDAGGTARQEVRKESGKKQDLSAFASEFKNFVEKWFPPEYTTYDIADGLGLNRISVWRLCNGKMGASRKRLDSIFKNLFDFKFDTCEDVEELRRCWLEVQNAQALWLRLLGYSP